MKIFKKIKHVWLNFSKKEKFLGLLFLTLTLIGLTKLSSFLINKMTLAKPAVGGIINYGSWESPKAINPLISQNNDTDQELSSLIFSSILKENGLGGFDYDIAKEIMINPDGKIIEITLKENIFFHDNKKLTADDILFTFNLIKNPVYQSPLLALIKDVRFEKMGEYMLRMILPNSYSNYHNILTIKILPKHLWENIDYSEFATTSLNQKPIGSGPFVINKVQKDRSGKITSILLIRNKKFYQNVFLNKIRIVFYNSHDEAFADFIKGRLDIIREITPYQKELLKNKGRIKIDKLILPRYYGIFINQKNSLIANPNLVRALELLIDKEKIINEVFFKDADLINAPISKDFVGFVGDLNHNLFDPIEAKNILAEEGFIDSDGDGILDKTKNKTKTNLEFTLLLPSINELIHLTDIIKKSWSEAGIKTYLQILPLNELYRDYLKNRNYDALLFGQTYTLLPDLYYFWHSTQANNLGLNLSLYKNASIDSLLELNRTETNIEKRTQYLKDFQEKLLQEKPAIFLNNPHYIYSYYKKLKINKDNIYSSFSSFLSNANNWYINENRALK